MSGKFRPARKDVIEFGHCLNERLGEILVPVKMQVTRDRTERPHGALLQFDIECLYHMYRIGRSLRDRDASFEGDVVGILPLCYGHSNPDR